MQQLIAIQVVFLLVGVIGGSEKRSPLEFGYVSFPQVIVKHKQHKDKKAVKSVLRNVWVPGHISHHAYVPAHHVIVPAVLVSRTVHTLLVKHHTDNKIAVYEDDPFRRTYGGFGVGLGVGGHGAGHGFHVVF